MSHPILKLQEVSKRFAGTEVVKQVSLTVEPGERIALLGHNGAGKTTLMKMILGLLRPTSGGLEVFGGDPGSSLARFNTAFLPENVAFHRSLTGDEHLAMYARLKGVQPAAVRHLMDKVDLADARRRAVGTYSKGMRQRLGLAQALIGDPRLVMLDEPTSGLDPVSRQTFYDIVAELADKGAAVLLSSHALTEVEARTDRIVIMRRGELIADDSLAALRSRAGLPARLMVIAKPDTADEVARRLGARRINGCAVEILCEPDDKLARLAAIAKLEDLVIDVDVVLPSLDDVYRHFSAPKQNQEAGHD